MYLVGIGLILLLCKYMEIGPVALWSWWLVLSPFVAATIWWYWADSTGYTKRKAMEAEQAKKQARIDRNKEAIGNLNSKRRK